VYCAPAEGVPRGIGIGAGVKKTRMYQESRKLECRTRLPDGRKSLKIGLIV